MKELVDIGINLMHSRYHKDRDEVVQRGFGAGVTRLIITGTSLWNSKSALTMAEKHPGKVFSTAGIHPHNAKDCTTETIKEIRNLTSHREVVAIGECALDFDRDFSPRDIQEKWFEEQVKLACELKLPLFLHEREAHEKFTEILSRYQEKIKNAVVHCFTGTENELRDYLDMGMYIGITGAICDERRWNLKQLVRIIPLDRLMIETDGPFLIPRDMRPRPKDNRNEPTYLPHILKVIAESIEKSPEEVAEATTRNATDFFSLFSE